MANGGYKIIDLEGLELKRNTTNSNTSLFEKIERAEKSSKPILITNVKFTSDGADLIEITVPIFLNVVKYTDLGQPDEKNYIFILPNGITGTITNESITIS